MHGDSVSPLCIIMVFISFSIWEALTLPMRKGTLKLSSKAYITQSLKAQLVGVFKGSWLVIVMHHIVLGKDVPC